MKLIFAGTPTNAAQALERLARHHEVVLAITRPDAQVGRSRELRQSPVAEAAGRLGIRVLKTNRFDDSQIETIESAKADLAIVIAFGAIISERALKILPWWNIHFSLLPKWRGASPLQMSMVTGEASGISIFQIDSGLDTGPIIRQHPIEFLAGETSGAALERFTTQAIDVLLEVLQSEVRLQPQQGEPTYAGKINRQKARISFDLTAQEIDRRVRAYYPEPIAWTESQAGELRILRGLPLGNVNWEKFEDKSRELGTVIFDSQKVSVVCGSGTHYELLEVQPAGKKPMSAADWFRGQRGGIRFE
ncbi:MAG: hypothetical protein RLZZ579_343 [Actinomycetota bacterium]